MLNAKDLIAKRAETKTYPLTPVMAKEVKQLLAHNDSAGGCQRVGWKATVELLQGMGWKGKTRKNLEDSVRACFKRGWGK